MQLRPQPVANVPAGERGCADVDALTTLPAWLGTPASAFLVSEEIEGHQTDLMAEIAPLLWAQTELQPYEIEYMEGVFRATIRTCRHGRPRGRGMALQRGFKSEAECVAIAVRAQELTYHQWAPDPWRLAGLYRVPVRGISEVQAGPATVEYVALTNPRLFSGALLPSGTGRVIAEKDRREPPRRRSTVCHDPDTTEVVEYGGRIPLDRWGAVLAHGEDDIGQNRILTKTLRGTPVSALRG